MKILVCGSRDWTDQDEIADVLAEYAPEENVTVIHGNARGADRLAAEVARIFGYEVRAFPAKWRPLGRYNPRAGLDRNLTMLDEKPDKVIAFQRNGSTGTQHTIDHARKRGIPVEVYVEDDIALDEQQERGGEGA